MSEAKHKCIGRVWTGLRHVDCGRGAKYEHEGGWYCKTHHPPTVSAKNAARNAEWGRKWDAREKMLKAAESARNERERRAAMFEELLDALQLLVRHIGVTEFAQDAEPFNTVRAVLAKAEVK